MATEPLNFRLDPKVKRLFVQRAKLAGEDLSAFFRQWVYDRLAEEDTARLREDVEAMRDELGELRSDMAKTLEAILIATGIMPDEAKDAVRSLLRRKPRSARSD